MERKVSRGGFSRTVGGAALLLLLLAGGFVATRYYLDRSDTASGTPTNPQPTAPPVAERQPRLVLAMQTYRTGRPRYTLINYDILKYKLRQRRLTLPHPLFDSTTRIHRNRLIQWSEDGQVMAYSLGRPWSSPHIPREGGPAVLPKPTRSYRLVVERSGKSEAIIDGEEPYRYPNWILAPSGQFIVFVRVQAQGKRAYTDQLTRSVYKYDLSSKQLTKLLDVTGFGIVDNGPMYLSADESQVTWLRYAGREFHRLVLDLGTGKTEDGVIYSKDLADAFPIVADQEMLSPNHQFAVLPEQDGPDWKIKLLNMESGKLTDLVNLGATHSVTSIRWSPDGSNIVYANVPSGAGGPGRTFEMALLDVRNKAKTTIATNKTTNLRMYQRNCAGGLAPLDFSPDGKWLAYVKNCRLGLYDIAQQKPGPSIYDFDRPLVAEPPGYAWVGF